MAESTRSKNRRAKDDDADTGGEAGQARDDQSASDGENRESGNSAEGSGESASLSAKELTEAGRETIAELTGLEPQSVTGLEWDGESWLVTVDMLELSRIPETTDVIATYVVQLDPSGGLLGYRRSRRFVRGHVED
jgi:Gas vesicle synthesis protein GvpO